MRKNGKVYRKNADGSSQPVISEAKYDSQVLAQRMERAKKNEDLNSWTKYANEKFDKLQQQLNDPNTDELEKETVMNDIQDLIAQFTKYNDYGGFTKPKKGKAPKKVSLDLDFDIPKIPELKSPTIKMSNVEVPKVQPIKAKRIKVPKIKVKRSISTIPGAKRLA